MSDAPQINVETNVGFWGMAGKALRSPAFWALLAFIGWTWAFNQYFGRADLIHRRLAAVAASAKVKNQKDNSRIEGAQADDLKAIYRRKAARRQREQTAGETLKRYEGMSDAFVPADVHGAIQKVR